MSELSAPFPWFGGKKLVADKIWAALGDVDHYVEPFFGSGAVHLLRPHEPKVETVNDLDGLLANFWRAIRLDPDAVAFHADWPTNEADLHARHLWLVSKRNHITKLMADPEAFDAKAAGWWVWGLCNWIGGGWCSGNGPWIAQDGELTDSRKLPRLSAGQGINRQLPHLGNAGRGEKIADWFRQLSNRFRETRVACGDWKRVCGPSVLRAGGGTVGVFLDPPYDMEGRESVYAMETGVLHDVRQWCIENGNAPDTRIVLAGYAGEHDDLETIGWRAIRWKAQGGYGSQGADTRGRENSTRETLWLSPQCIGATPDLFSFGESA